MSSHCNWTNSNTKHNRKLLVIRRDPRQFSLGRQVSKPDGEGESLILQRFNCLRAFFGVTLLCAGPAWSLSSVEIHIVDAPEEVVSELESAVEAASLSQRALDQDITDIQEIYGAAVSEYRQIIGVLYGEGFYGPSISVTADGREVSDISPLAVPDAIDKIVITVSPGPAFRFGTAQVDPRAPEADQGTPVVSGFAPGEPARSGLVGAAANAGVREWREGGHAKATIGGQDVIARHNDQELDVDIQIEPGPKLRFGNVSYAGTSDVREKRIREMLGLPTGEVYSPEELNDAANRLRRSGAFKTVVLKEAETPNADGTLDYSLTVIDELPRRFGFSAEFSTVDGALVSGFWLHRNVFGGAERFRVDGEIAGIGSESSGYADEFGGVDYKTSFRLSRPAAWGPDNTAFIFGELEHLDEPDYLEQQATLGIGINRHFSDDLYGEVAGGLRYSRAEDAFGNREFNHVIFPSRLEWDKRGNEGDPRNGFFFDARVTPLVGYNGSADLIHLDLDNRAYVSFGANDLITLAGRVQIGSDLGASTEDTPPDYLFFSGGGDTVRGQRYQSLGAGENNGDTVGGRSFLGVSAEVRSRITDTLGVVGFVDYGFVGSESWIDEDSNEHSGLGLGVRYATPIGPIRVDIATPFTGDVEEFSRVELYIGVGQAF